ncbi:hypothetical protein Tco_0536344 [Tanacetum coccineum]
MEDNGKSIRNVKDNAKSCKTKRNTASSKPISAVKTLRRVYTSLLPTREKDQKNKNVESLKTTTSPFLELYAPLFDGTLSTGVKSDGPSSIEPRRVLEAHVVEDDEETEVVNVDSPTPSCSSLIANKINQPTSKSPPKPKPPSVEDCENSLNGLKWDEDDPLYKTALAIFCDPNDHYRECWMKLKPERKKSLEYQHYKKPNDGTTAVFMQFGHNIILEYARETIFCCLKPMVHGEHMEIEAKDLTGNSVSSIAERQTNFINDSGSRFLKTSVKA